MRTVRDGADTLHRERGKRGMTAHGCLLLTCGHDCLQAFESCYLEFTKSGRGRSTRGKGKENNMLWEYPKDMVLLLQRRYY